MPPLNLYARVRFFAQFLRTRPRVQRAPGIPCSLIVYEGHERRISSGRASPASIDVRPGLVWSPAAGGWVLFRLLSNKPTIFSLAERSIYDLAVETQERHNNVRPP